MHTGQRNLFRIRISRDSFARGLRLKDFGEVLYSMIMDEFSSVVDKCAVTFITDKEKVQDAEPDNDDPTVEVPETEEKPAAPRVEIISGNKVNIRVGNDTKYSRITQVVGGTTFEWIATAANGWHAVVVGSRIGWVSGKYSRVI